MKYVMVSIPLLSKCGQSLSDYGLSKVKEWF